MCRAAKEKKSHLMWLLMNADILWLPYTFRLHLKNCLFYALHFYIKLYMYSYIFFSLASDKRIAPKFIPVGCNLWLGLMYETLEMVELRHTIGEDYPAWDSQFFSRERLNSRLSRIPVSLNAMGLPMTLHPAFSEEISWRDQMTFQHSLMRIVNTYIHTHFSTAQLSEEIPQVSSCHFCVYLCTVDGCIHSIQWIPIEKHKCLLLY